MANGYSQSPAQGREVNPPTNTNEGASFDPDLLGEVSYVDGTTSYDNEGFKLTSDMEAYLAGQQPYVEDVEPTPYPIIGEIKFQKIIYSQPSFRKRIDVSFNELNNKGGEIFAVYTDASVKARNYKALEGVVKTLKWTLGDRDIQDPLN